LEPSVVILVLPDKLMSAAPPVPPLPPLPPIATEAKRPIPFALPALPPPAADRLHDDAVGPVAKGLDGRVVRGAEGSSARSAPWPPLPPTLTAPLWTPRHRRAAAIDCPRMPIADGLSWRCSCRN